MVGAEPRAVRIEAHVGAALEKFTLVGLPDTSIREAKQRVKAAITSSGHKFPSRNITVNLSPADLPKAGADYDLPIALGVLAAARVIPPFTRVIVAGELALDGTVRRSRWAIGAGLLAAKRGWPCLVAKGDAPNAARVPGARVFGISSLAEAVAFATSPPEPTSPAPREAPGDDGIDMAEVRGQPFAATRARDRGGGWSSRPDGGLAGLWEDDAGQAISRLASPADRSGSSRSRLPVGGRGPTAPVFFPTSFPLSTSLGLDGRDPRRG